MTFLAAAIGGAGSAGSGAFYADLVLPTWAPPSWLFGPVWTTLYLLMGIAAWLVWCSGDARSVRLPLALFLGQLVLNALWSWLFFGWRLGGLAFAEILLLLVVLLATVVAFRRVRPVAGWLLLPYLLWVSFAAALNLAIWQRNPGLL